MESNPGFELDDYPTYRDTIQINVTNTFCKSKQDSVLYVGKLSRMTSVEDMCNPKFVHEEVHEPWQIGHYAETKNDECQVFSIKQKHSYSPLYVDRELFEKLLRTYSVFLLFWDFVFSFGMKTRETDAGHTAYRYRQISLSGKTTPGSFECAYSFRYVEQNFRPKLDEDHEPWSIRQSAVYQQRDRNDRIVFILITTVNTARTRLEKTLERTRSQGRKVNEFDLHRILISSAQENWRWYLKSLESRINDLAEQGILQVSIENGSSLSQRPSTLLNFNISFTHRQRLKILEDKVLELFTVFESLRDTVSNIKEQCLKNCRCMLEGNCSCSTITNEFETQLREIHINQQKTKALHEKAKGTAQLLSNLLAHENAQIAHKNEKTLNRLVEETREENRAIRRLSEKGVKDAAAVKVLTIITLIYLPITVVANFFSSQLVNVQDNGTIIIASSSWWFAVVSVPLTILTILVWLGWVRYAAYLEKRRCVFNMGILKGQV